MNQQFVCPSNVPECVEVEKLDISATEMLRLMNKFAEIGRSGDRANGYLPQAGTLLACKAIIESSNIALRWYEGSLAGYYIADHWRYTYSPSEFSYFENIFLDACKSHQLDPLRVACGAQSVIDVPFQGKGLRQDLLKELTEKLKVRYDACFSKITKDNARALAGHSKDGWIGVSEDDKEIFVLLRIGPNN